MSYSEEASRALIESSAGFVAGVAATLVAHPLDLVKTRLQVSKKPLASKLGATLQVFRSVVRFEGGFRGLYRGLTPNIVGNSTSWALYFLCYDRAKNLVSKVRGHDELSYGDFFLASASAGTVTAACTNPIWVIKTRMLSTSAGFDGAYTSLFSGVRQIYASDGLRGFYRGLLPSLFGVSHGALQFMVYEKMKIFRQGQGYPGRSQLSSLDFIALSGTSKLIAGTVTYPYQVVRSRLQTYDAERTYRGVLDVIAQTSRQEGLGGFYRGIVPNMLRVLPSTCVTFLVYESARSFGIRRVSR